MPSFNHQTARRDSRPAPVVANGEPLSVRSARGNPYVAKRALEPRPHPDRAVGATMRQHSTNRLHASATVSGSQRVPSAVRNQPLKSAVQTSFGACAAASGCVSGTTYRSRRRGVLRPFAAQADRPSCSRAGQRCVRLPARRSSAAQFCGPQCGCARRSASIAVAHVRPPSPARGCVRRARSLGQPGRAGPPRTGRPTCRPSSD